MSLPKKPCPRCQGCTGIDKLAIISNLKEVTDDQKKECFAGIYSLKFVNGVATLSHLPLPKNMPKSSCCTSCKTNKTDPNKKPKDKTTQFPEDQREYNIHESETVKVELTKPTGEKEVKVTKTESSTKFTKEGNINTEIRITESTTKFVNDKNQKKETDKDNIVKPTKSNVSDSRNQQSTKSSESERSVILRNLKSNANKTVRGHGGESSSSDSKMPDKQIDSEEKIETFRRSTILSENEPSQETKVSARNLPKTKRGSSSKKNDVKLIKKRHRVKRVEVAGENSIPGSMIDKLTNDTNKKNENSDDIQNSVLRKSDTYSALVKEEKKNPSNFQLTKSQSRFKTSEVVNELDGTVKSVYTVQSFSDEEIEKKPKIEIKEKPKNEIKEKSKIEIKEKPKPEIQVKMTEPQPEQEEFQQLPCNFCRLSPCPYAYRMPCTHMYPFRYTCCCNQFHCNMNCCCRNQRFP